MSKSTWRQVALAVWGIVTPLTIQIVSRNFSQRPLLEQTIGVSAVMFLIGFFFGLWLPHPIRLVVRHYQFRGFRGVKMLSLFTPWLALFVLLLSPLSSNHDVAGVLFSSTLIATFGTVVFWLTALPVRLTFSTIGKMHHIIGSLPKNGPGG